MESSEHTDAGDRPGRRRWRRVGFVLIILAVLETAGWVGDYLGD